MDTTDLTREQLFAAPWSAPTLDTAQERFTLKVPNDSLADAPGSDKDQWPTVADTSWASGVHKFHGTEAPDMNRTETLSDRLSKHGVPTPGRADRRVFEGQR